jgi:hypothetical protein
MIEALNTRFRLLDDRVGLIEVFLLQHVNSNHQTYRQT